MSAVYTVLRATVRGYRGGTRNIGWRVMFMGEQVRLFQFKASATDFARMMNRSLSAAPSHPDSAERT